QPDRLAETSPIADAATTEIASSETHLVEIAGPAPRAAATDAAPDSVEVPVTATTATTTTTGGFNVVAEHTVESGDSPAKIAVKFYGPKEGNRLVNINRLMAANNITNPTRLRIGQKLVIPALPDGPERLVAMHPDSFVRTDGAATPAASTARTQTRQAPGTREYVVVQGDSLWAIAAKSLGSGARYREILKLNSDRLGSDGSRLTVGMKLRIPAQ
ncbi:MAG TPA: LysM peptidoglycan-binding domain-containing protein, partial [Sedimentisphaerales bacterium]|nr:LysM peptidoglycan-binding domain-containing protein [Sedimentisphaerales bacterium]